MKNRISILLYSSRGRLFLISIFLLLFYFFCGKNAPSDSLNLRPEVGTRGLGLSGAFIGSADDATSPLWNPAGLATLQRGNLIYDLSQGAFSIAYPIKSIGTFGINVLDLNDSDRFLIKHTSNPIGSFELGNNQALFSYARKFGFLQLGGSTGYSRAPYYGSLWAQNYDIGILASLNPYVTLGLRLRDISGVTIQDQNGAVLQTFDQQLALGASLTPHPIIRWHNRVNITDPGFGTSLEIGNENIAARIGSMFSFTTDAPVPAWSIGVSLNQLGKQLHYTYLNHEAVEHKHLISIGMFFGKQQGASKKPENGAHSQNKPLQIAKEYGIDIELLLAIVHTESNFNPVAVSKSGASGLMQLMPDTARELGLKVPNYKNKRKPKHDAKVDERFNPTKNLHAGLTYFNKLFKKYGGNLTLALGAYNVGPGRVRVRGPLISTGKRYAKKVQTRSELYRDKAGQMESDLKRLEAVLSN